jgi:hypothetical protein
MPFVAIAPAALFIDAGANVQDVWEQQRPTLTQQQAMGCRNQ